LQSGNGDKQASQTGIGNRLKEANQGKEATVHKRSAIEKDIRKTLRLFERVEKLRKACHVGSRKQRKGGDHA